MPEVFFTSDHHFNHKNIIGFCDRPFSSVEEMNEGLIESWNEVVGPKDHVFHLGDFSFGSAKPFLSRLNGSVALVRGNHDKPKSSDGFAWIKDFYIFNLEGVKLVLFHYAMRTWPGIHRGVPHLYGHSHGKLPGLGKSMDVGVDSNNYRPISLEEVLQQMEKK